MDRRASFIRRTTRSAWACGVVALGVLGGLVVAEAIVRVFSPDFRYVDKIVPRQTVILSSLEADPDPRVRYRLRPGLMTRTRAVEWARRGPRNSKNA